jgi:hypothetical protein
MSTTNSENGMRIKSTRLVRRCRLGTAAIPADAWLAALGNRGSPRSRQPGVVIRKGGPA